MPASEAGFRDANRVQPAVGRSRGLELEGRGGGVRVARPSTTRAELAEQYRWQNIRCRRLSFGFISEGDDVTERVSVMVVKFPYKVEVQFFSLQNKDDERNLASVPPRARQIPWRSCAKLFAHSQPNSPIAISSPPSSLPPCPLPPTDYAVIKPLGGSSSPSLPPSLPPRPEAR